MTLLEETLSRIRCADTAARETVRKHIESLTMPRWALGRVLDLAVDLGYEDVAAPPYEAVVIGSLSLSQLLRFQEEAVLEALAEGKTVLLYTPGLPQAPKHRALAAALTAGSRELKSWGVIFTDGGRRRLVTAEEARQMRLSGKRPGPGAVLTPLAKEILGGTE